MRQSAGFTLAELMTAIAVAGLLADFALPSFARLQARSRAASEANAFLSLITLTRSEAVRRNAPATMCKTSDGISCSSAVVVGWDRGVIVFADDGRDPHGGPWVAARRGNGVLDAGEAVIQVEFPFSTRSRVTSVGNAAARLSYRADGRMTDVLNTTITIVPNGDPAMTRKIAVAVTGRPRILP